MRVFAHSFIVPDLQVWLIGQHRHPATSRGCAYPHFEAHAHRTDQRKEGHVHREQQTRVEVWCKGKAYRTDSLCGCRFCLTKPLCTSTRNRGWKARPHLQVGEGGRVCSASMCRKNLTSGGDPSIVLCPPSPPGSKLQMKAGGKFSQTMFPTFPKGFPEVDQLQTRPVSD